ncbi:MAG: histidine phosphatase family protein, partial [Bacteroidota bacterium]
AIFSHGMAIKCLFRKISQANPHLTYRISLDNTSVCHFRYSERGWHLGRINDHAHLELLNV